MATERTTRRPLKIGINLPSGEGLMAGQTPHWPDIRAMTVAAEQAGYDSLWLPDHFLMKFSHGFTHPRGTWDCWTLLASMAAITDRVELGTLVSSTTFRNPALLARIADTIEDVSGGRLILGVGAGDSPYEHEAYGVPYDHRASRFEEAIQIIRGLLREGQVTFDGRFYQAHEAEIRPRGPRPQGPPIMIGARVTSPRMLRLCVEYADIWNEWVVFGNSHPEAVRPQLQALDEACEAAGRDPKTLARSIAVMVDYSGRTEFRRGEQPLLGSPEELADACRQFAAEGVSHLQIVFRPTTVETIERFAPVLGLLDQG
ncbi:MAG TPA: LLM class flavin-dependent oxidoreductase [Nitrolancea sp.]|nr:LLM class flavin-dependent oxidoreductase [Nitrolancea sp.]